MTDLNQSNPESSKDKIITEEKQEECAKLLNDLFEVKKVNKMIELNPKRRVNIGKLIKSVANCYDCRVSKFDDPDKLSTEEEGSENELEQDYYDVEHVSKTNKLIITDKRNNKKQEINLTEFRNFLENKYDVTAEENNSDHDTTITEESKEDRKFHFLKFELILREFYKKNEIRKNMKNNYKTNEVKKVNLGFSYIKQPALANTYQGKNFVYNSPPIKKNFFEDHKKEIKKIDKRRKTMFAENNILDKLKNDLDQKKAPHSQAPKFVIESDDVKEVKDNKVSSFSANVEETKDNSQHKNSIKMDKRTSIFESNMTFFVDKKDSDDDKDSENSQD